MTNQKICIHGHFYQPLRINPWLDEILPEGTAAPYENWNKRIARESYLPLAFTRIMQNGKISKIINCYEWMNFNFGPTLLKWIRENEPLLYNRILDGDAKSLERTGAGNAIAQCYHHAIMPLLNKSAKISEISWAINDFKYHFKRFPEGFWLPETACNIETLQVLADFDIKYVILAPRQAHYIKKSQDREWTLVDEFSLDKSMPYMVNLAENKRISIFFYDGVISQAIAFENLLRDGDILFNKLRTSKSFLSIATDGETYGHHVKFGEMALGYFFDKIFKDENYEVTNYAAFLKETKYQGEVKIHENSSWSCVHGVERWKSDCGCCTGEHPNWNQKWRKYLREACDFVLVKCQELLVSEGKIVFNDVALGYQNYICFLNGAIPFEDFLKLYFKEYLNEAEILKGFKLLEMLRLAMAAQTSCGWFFDDISRIEPLNNMCFASKSLEIYNEITGVNLSGKFVQFLSGAISNEDHLSGKELFEQKVQPQIENPASLVSLCLVVNEATYGDLKKYQKYELKFMNFEVVLYLKADDVLEGAASVNIYHLKRDYDWKLNNHSSLFEGEMVATDLENFKTTSCNIASFTLNKRNFVSDMFIKRINSDVLSYYSNLKNSGSCFTDFEEHQTQPIKASYWDALLPALIINYVFNYDKFSHNSLKFLKLKAESFEIESPLIEYISHEICKMINSDQKLATLCIRRCLEIGIVIDLWKLQNQVEYYNIDDIELKKMLNYKE